MFSRVHSGIICGADSRMVQVEVDISNGFPAYTMVGYLASEVKESRERVITALKNSGFILKPAKITVNFAPADFRKDGTAFDLPVAAALMAAADFVPVKQLEDTMVVGELGLDGTVTGVRGVLPLVFEAKACGMKRCIVPFVNACEGAVIEGIEVIGIRNLMQFIQWLRGNEDVAPTIAKDRSMDGHICRPGCNEAYDFGDLYGQEVLKQTIEAAVAGMHHLLLIGPPGTGKSMAAACVPSVLPDMTFEESIEVTKLYSIAGLTGSGGLITKRPFRQPHHTIPAAAMVGGGVVPTPGEISLAHRGVLFLDELAEFNSQLIEMLRQPLENRCITINRVQGSYVFPGDFMLIAAMNPCPCGYYPDKSRCRCSDAQIKRYLGKISFPILDRFDIAYEVNSVDLRTSKHQKINRTSAQIRQRVEAARKIQLERFKDENFYFNSQIRTELLEKYCPLDTNCRMLLEDRCEAYRISARGGHKIIRTARTLADLDGCAAIEERHILTAADMKCMNGWYWHGGTWYDAR